MTAKEWLNRCWKLEQEINALIEAQQRALDMATCVSVRYDRERVQQQSKGPENAMASYAEYSRMLDERIDELVEMKQEILQAINCIDNEIQRAILVERYINHKKWEEIIKNINYAERNIYKLHAEALKKIKLDSAVQYLV